MIGGFSSTGKTAFGCNMAADAILQSEWTAIVSTEMTAAQYMIRLVSLFSGVPCREVVLACGFYIASLLENDRQTVQRAAQST